MPTFHLSTVKSENRKRSHTYSCCEQIRWSLKTILYLLLVYLIASPCSAQDRVHVKKKRFRLSPLPVLYYSPETRLGYGGLLAVNFETTKKHDSVTKSSYIQSSFIYTVNDQYDFFNIARIYTPRNRDIIQVRFDYAYFPEFYYGYETQNPNPLKDLIQYNRIVGDVRYYRKIKHSIYAGLVGHYNHIYHVASDPDGSLALTQPPGHDGYSVLGLAPAFSIDRRDSQIYPQKGFFLEVLFGTYPSQWSGAYSFNTFKLDVRKYFPVKGLKNGVIALQALFNLNSGNVPFKDMADIGGSYMTRGYYTGFYRYKNLYAFQAEYRATLTGRLGMVVWGGCALTALQWDRPFEFTPKPNAGLGLRFMINRADKLNVRFDQGFGNQGQNGFYLDIAEAF